MSFAQLIQAAQRGTVERAPLPDGRGHGVQFRARQAQVSEAHGSRTKALLQLLRKHGPQTTRDLADATGMTGYQVGCLLKHCKARGQALRDGDRWVFNPAHDAEALANGAVGSAVALLRRLGWTVTPPAA